MDPITSLILFFSNKKMFDNYLPGRILQLGSLNKRVQCSEKSIKNGKREKERELKNSMQTRYGPALYSDSGRAV